MLKIEGNSAESHQEFKLIGNLDESTEGAFANLIKDISKPQIVFNCREVSQINSIGVRIWIEFLKKVSSTAKVSVAECSEMFMDYRALIPAMTLNADILSVAVIFECRNCGTKIDKIVHKAEFSVDLDFGSIPCKKCSHAATAGCSADDLFSFLEE